MTLTARPKAAPPLPGVPMSSHVRVRRDKIDIGVITIHHNSRLHHVGLGGGLSGTRVLALVDGLRVRVITEDGKADQGADPRSDPRLSAARPDVTWNDVPRHGTMSRDITQRAGQDSNLRPED